METLLTKLSSPIQLEFEIKRMKPLFQDENEYEEFCKRHNTHGVVTDDCDTVSTSPSSNIRAAFISASP